MKSIASLLIVIAVTVSACAPTSKATNHFSFRMEHTNVQAWTGQTEDWYTFCDKTAVVGPYGYCPTTVTPILQTTPGWADKLWAGLTQMAALVPSALILNNGMRNIPASNIQTSASANGGSATGGSATATVGGHGHH